MQLGTRWSGKATRVATVAVEILVAFGNQLQPLWSGKSGQAPTIVLCILLGVQMSLESGIGRRAPWITTCSSVSVWSHLAGLRIERSIQGRFALLYGVLLRLWRVR